MSELPPCAILSWDEAIVVVDKPAGLLVIRGGYVQDPYLTQLLEPTFGRLWVVHRLDRDTSGVLVLARSAAAHRALNAQFEQRRVHKVYHALVVGAPTWTEQTVDLPLRRDGDRRHRTVVDLLRGKHAVTRFRVLERFGCCALVEALPMTGRTHQIRAHLAALGLPLAGDPLYHVPRDHPAASAAGGGAQPPLIARTALHALALTFYHPSSGEETTCRAPYPADLSAAIDRLCQSG
ncbi:MAG: RluA family pseudouridine synthase [Anaerolineae bacterium]|nr:RluA family pseudouridine synthase [Anaerolineae bacterium]